jgi:hypothetical protein
MFEEIKKVDDFQNAVFAAMNNLINSHGAVCVKDEKDGDTVCRVIYMYGITHIEERRRVSREGARKLKFKRLNATKCELTIKDINSTVVENSDKHRMKAHIFEDGNFLDITVIWRFWTYDEPTDCWAPRGDEWFYQAMWVNSPSNILKVIDSFKKKRFNHDISHI